MSDALSSTLRDFHMGADPEDALRAPPHETPVATGPNAPEDADLKVDSRHVLASETLSQMGRSLPLRPGPVMDLLTASPNDRNAVGSLGESDPVLAARLLGVVNAADGGNGQPQSVGDAIADLGSRHARALGLGLSVQTLILDPSVGDGWLNKWWEAALIRAHAAQLAHAAMLPRCGRTAYTMGLISDIALPLLMRMDPAFYHDKMPARPASQTWCDAERNRFGVDHAQAGAHLLSLWDVPASVCRLVRAHHQAPTGEKDLPLRTALFLSGLIAHDPRKRTDHEHTALIALYERLLAPHYRSPTVFVESAQIAASRRDRVDRTRDNGRWLDRALLLSAAAADCVDLVTRTHRLETARNRQAEDLSTLRFEAYTDPLTKTLNRRGFFDLARQRLDKHCGDLSACCMLLDLNKFKPVNDTHGHDVGDLMLRGLAKLLRRSVSRTDLIGRLGGDEFVVLITDINEAGAHSAAERLYNTCHDAQLRVSDELTLTLRLSLGAVFEPQLGDASQLDQMLAAADELMYQQKRTGEPGLRCGRVIPAADLGTNNPASTHHAPGSPETR